MNHNTCLHSSDANAVNIQNLPDSLGHVNILVRMSQCFFYGPVSLSKQYV